MILSSEKQISILRLHTPIHEPRVPEVAASGCFAFDGRGDGCVDDFGGAASAVSGCSENRCFRVASEECAWGGGRDDGRSCVGTVADVVARCQGPEVDEQEMEAVDGFLSGCAWWQWSARLTVSRETRAFGCPPIRVPPSPIVSRFGFVVKLYRIEPYSVDSSLRRVGPCGGIDPTISSERR